MRLYFLFAIAFFVSLSPGWVFAGVFEDIVAEGASPENKTRALAVCEGATSYRESGLAPCKQQVNEAFYIDPRLHAFCESTSDADFRHYCYREGKNRAFSAAEVSAAPRAYNGLGGKGVLLSQRLLSAAVLFQTRNPVEFCNSLGGQARNLCKGQVFDLQDMNREVSVTGLAFCALIADESGRADCGNVVLARRYDGNRADACAPPANEWTNLAPQQITECLAAVGKPWSEAPGDGGGEGGGGSPPDIGNGDGGGRCELTPERAAAVKEQLKDVMWTLDNSFFRDPDAPGGGPGMRNRVRAGAVLEAKVVVEALLEKLFFCTYGDLSPETIEKIDRETKRKRREIRNAHGNGGGPDVDGPRPPR